jgi:hypothetical protein
MRLFSDIRRSAAQGKAEIGYVQVENQKVSASCEQNWPVSAELKFPQFAGLTNVLREQRPVSRIASRVTCQARRKPEARRLTDSNIAVTAAESPKCAEEPDEQQKRQDRPPAGGSESRGGRIRTGDFLLPKQAL